MARCIERLERLLCAQSLPKLLCIASTPQLWQGSVTSVIEILTRESRSSPWRMHGCARNKLCFAILLQPRVIQANQIRCVTWKECSWVRRTSCRDSDRIHMKENEKLHRQIEELGWNLKSCCVVVDISQMDKNWIDPTARNSLCSC